MKKQITYYVNAILNSYAILFFSQHKIFGFLLLVASMFNIAAGLTGLACVVFSLFIVNFLGFNKDTAYTGLYSFNSLLLGIGFGSFFDFNASFWLWLIVASLLCIVISINLTAYLGKYLLPTLSIPFVIIFWLVLIATTGYAGMGLMQKNSYIVFELYTGSNFHFNQFNNFIEVNVPVPIGLFFRSLSAVLFQNNMIAGILIAVGLLIHSRIALSLLILGFMIACLINYFTGTYPDGISNYHLGANFMMISLAVGGFFLIPSFRSYLLAIVSVALTFLIVNGMSRVLGVYNLPIFSMPFSLLTLALLYFFMLRVNVGKLQITAIQNYAPETNLYQHLNGTDRFKDFTYFAISLPFMGSWRVSQDYDGDLTHQGDWSSAIDFVITDLDQKTFEFPGNKPEHYYCYNKPVLACADGFVAEVIQHIDDNPIGQVNLEQNWGNTIVIKHAEGLYSKVSHLKKNSAKVKQGDYITQGEVIALCGNSGRSPEPHLHFQLQATPYIGSKTMSYPFAYYQKLNDNHTAALKSFSVPKTGDLIQQPEINPYLKQAFNFEPGYRNKVATSTDIETWEVFTDAYNQTYLSCKENQSVAYFVKNANVFFFTRFYGDKKSLLYLFYLAAYKINFSAHPVEDYYAADSESFNPKLWLQDLVSPFLIYIKTNYKNHIHITNDGVVINAVANKKGFSNNKDVMIAKIFTTQFGITGFEVNTEHKKSTLKCSIKSI
jgi:urea transporter/murein DD-endopeptidase MepM/ murein hydrolase activator NlpD